MNDTPYFQYLDEIKKEAEEVAGLWNGDESGKQEENADCANDIITKCNEIKELINLINE